MAEILHQLIGSSSQYLKGLSTTPGGFLAGFLVAIFPVFYDYIFGSPGFPWFPVSGCQSNPPLTSHHKHGRCFQAFRVLAAFSWPHQPTKNHDRRHHLGSNGSLQQHPGTSKASTFWVKFCIFLVTSKCRFGGGFRRVVDFCWWQPEIRQATSWGKR